VSSIFTVPLLGLRIPRIMLSIVVLPAAGRAHDIEDFPKVSLEVHVAHGVRSRLALAEPFVEAAAMMLSPHAHPRKISKGLDLQDLAHTEIGSSWPRSRPP